MSIEVLVVKYMGWIRKTAQRYYNNKFDADDLASETIFKILSQGEKYNADKSFKPWALTIMANTYKTQYNRRRCVLFTGYNNYDSYISSESSEQRMRVKQILSIVRECGRKSQNIESVILYAQGYSYEEIAEIVGIPVGTVKSRVASGRKMLRNAFE